MKAFYIPQKRSFSCFFVWLVWFWNSMWNDPCCSLPTWVILLFYDKFWMPSFCESTPLHVCKLIKIRVRRFNRNCPGLGHVRLWFYSRLSHINTFACFWLARLLRWSISNLFVWNLGLQFISSFIKADNLFLKKIKIKERKK